MSRDVPTVAEQACGNALASFYRSTGHVVSTVQYADKPDLRLVVDELPVACECVQIPPARIFGFVHARFKQIELKTPGAKAVQVIWPKEAHIWVREAIAEKNRLAHVYRRSTGDSELNLLIHTPFFPNSDVLDPRNLEEMNQIRWAGATSKSQFTNIFFFDSRFGVERLFPPTKAIVEPTYDFSHGYPTSGFVLSSAGPFKTTAEGENPIDYDFGDVNTEVVVVPPIDARFQKYTRLGTNLSRPDDLAGVRIRQAGGPQ